MAKKKAATSGTSHLLKDLNLSAEHQGIVDLVHNANKGLREGTVPKEHVAEVQKLVKEHVVHLHKNLPKETVTQIFTRLAPAEGERNALREAVHETPKVAAIPAKKESFSDTIAKRLAKDKASPDYKPAVYPNRIPDEEPVVTKPKKSSKKVSPWKDVVNPEVKSESSKELLAQWKVGKPEEVEAKRKSIFASGRVEGEVELSGARKLREAGQGADELEAKMKLQAAGPTLDINESKKAAAKAHNERAAALRAADKPKPVDLHATIDTKAVLAGKSKEQRAADKSLAAQLKKATAENKRLRAKAGGAISPSPTPAPPEVGTGEVKLSISNPPPPPAPAPVTTKTVVAEPVAAKVEPAAITKAAKAPALAGVEKLTKSDLNEELVRWKGKNKVFEKNSAAIARINEVTSKPKANPVGKKIHNIFEELKTSVEGRKDTPKAAGSRAAIFEAGQKLEAKPEKPATVKSIFKGLTPGKGDPLAKLAVSVEGENLKQASRAGTTPDVESPRAKLRMEMDEAGKAMKRFDPVKKYTPPVKLTRPPMEMPYSDAEVGKKTSAIFEELKTSVANRPKVETAAEATPEWLSVARKAATAAEEGSTVSKAAKVGELASKTAGKLGKLGIAGLAIYGGIEALKKIGEKLKE